jgi:AcrR family transcriptional regulator
LTAKPARPRGLTEGKVGRPQKAVTDRLDETLLDLAAEAMRDANFSEISLELLAARIGVSRPTLYRRFENRNALVKALVEREFASLFDTASEAAPQPQTDPVAALRDHAWAMFGVFLRPSTANFVQFLTMESQTNPRLTHSRREWHLRVIDGLMPLIECAQGERAKSRTAPPFCMP